MRTILLLSMLSQFTYFSPPQEANTCVNCALIPTYLHIALIILLYVDNIHEIYMLQVESNRWNLIFLCVASIPLLWIIALWVNSYARLIDACLESTIHEKSLLYDSVVYSCHYLCFDRCIHYIMFTNSMIKIMMACHFRNYLCYRFTCSGRAELSLGMLIRLQRIDNFLCSMPHYWCYLHVLCTLYVIFVHFLELTY
jgi:hypothetical protein